MMSSNLCAAIYLYDDAGNTVSVTDANGNTMTHAYDDLNRRISTTNAAGETSTTTFDDAGNVLTSTNPRGNVMTYTYDLRNRVTQVADSLGVVSQTTFDDAGRRLTQTDGNGNTMSFTYDDAGRVTATTDALGNSSSMTYDDAGNVLTTTDREGNVTTHMYDDLNRRVSTTDALGNTTSYAFNAVGNLTSITDARGNVTSYTYDNLNRRITETYPDAAPNTKTFTYDAVGNLLTRTDQKGQVQTHVYDDLYRMLSRSTPGWVADTFTYDVGGRMLSATRDTWVVTYTYDVANRVVQTTQGGRTIGYAYDIPNGTRTITYPGGRVITEQRDLRSRLSGVKEGAVNIATYSYDNGNRVDTRTYNNGVVADYTYDANNRITSLTHDLGATLIAGFTHAYDNEGNKKYEEQQHNPTRSEGYQYDSIYRLVDYKVGALVAGTVPVPTTQTAYNLDEVGNWDSKTTDAVTENRTHNAANEITAIDATAITSDDNGNLIQDANFNYTFDENNRLIQVVNPQSVVISQYSYDALGRRISKVFGSATTLFLYDNARIIEERDGSNNVQATYTYGNYIDEVLTKDAGANRYYYHQNTLWSVHALTDATGAVVERYMYDAYGAISVLDPLYVPLSSAPLAYFTFTGREYDAESALYHYRARTYGAALGRFYSRDPLGYVDGMNLFNLALNNPVKRNDPFGFYSINDVTNGLGFNECGVVILVTHTYNIANYNIQNAGCKKVAPATCYSASKVPPLKQQNPWNWVDVPLSEGIIGNASTVADTGWLLVNGGYGDGVGGFVAYMKAVITRARMAAEQMCPDELFFGPKKPDPVTGVMCDPCQLYRTYASPGWCGDSANGWLCDDGVSDKVERNRKCCGCQKMQLKMVSPMQNDASSFGFIMSLSPAWINSIGAGINSKATYDCKTKTWMGPGSEGLFKDYGENLW